MKASESYLRRQYLCVLRRCAWNHALKVFIGTVGALHGSGAAAQSVVVDGRTQTSLSVQGAVTDVTTRTVHGKSGFNSFHRFNIGNGQTVNLHLPQGTANLLNLVQGERSQLDGVLNAYKDGRIGGNVFFLNPLGVVVGAGGTLNVGNLTLATPTQPFMSRLMDGAGAIDGAALEDTLAGRIPLSDSGLVRVAGRIIAGESVHLIGGQIRVDAGARFWPGRKPRPCLPTW